MLKNILNMVLYLLKKCYCKFGLIISFPDIVLLFKYMIKNKRSRNCQKLLIYKSVNILINKSYTDTPAISLSENTREEAVNQVIIIIIIVLFVQLTYSATYFLDLLECPSGICTI